jgi:hypothetical protein
MKILGVIFVLALAASFIYIAYALIEAAVITFIAWFKGNNTRTEDDSQSWIDDYRKRNSF